MKKTVFAAVLTLFTMASGSAMASGKPTGTEAKGKPAGVACMQAGISTLQTLGLLDDVAAGGIEVVGVGTLDFQTVLSLHRTNPELFNGDPETAVTVVIPGAEVLAFWCE